MIKIICTVCTALRKEYKVLNSWLSNYPKTISRCSASLSIHAINVHITVQDIPMGFQNMCIHPLCIYPFSTVYSDIKICAQTDRHIVLYKWIFTGKK